MPASNRYDFPGHLRICAFYFAPRGQGSFYSKWSKGGSGLGGLLRNARDLENRTYCSSVCLFPDGASEGRG